MTTQEVQPTPAQGPGALRVGNGHVMWLAVNEDPDAEVLMFQRPAL